MLEFFPMLPHSHLYRKRVSNFWQYKMSKYFNDKGCCQCEYTGPAKMELETVKEQNGPRVKFQKVFIFLLNLPQVFGITNEINNIT
jgi:hypothetical protein